MRGGPRFWRSAFALPDLLVVLGLLALLTTIGLAIQARHKGQARKAVCAANVKNITRAVLEYAEANRRVLPAGDQAPRNSIGIWWYYKELVKTHLGLTGPASQKDTQFACPDDRGYTDPGPFYRSSKYHFGSYVFNGITLPGMPSLAGKSLDVVRDPARTVLVREWTANAPLSWHSSRTGRKNAPFYNNAENMVGFVDGTVKYIPIYYDGMNPASTRDPIPGYDYKYSPE